MHNIEELRNNRRAMNGAFRTRPLVVIVDADEDARDLYGRWFFSLGFDVMCAIGIAGLAMALRRERPRLIITELRARDLTFGTFLCRLESDETTRCIPVVVLTSSTDDQALQAAKAAGAAAIQPKFLDFDSLRSWVVSLVEPARLKRFRQC